MGTGQFAHQCICWVGSQRERQSSGKLVTWRVGLWKQTNKQNFTKKLQTYRKVERIVRWLPISLPQAQQLVTSCPACPGPCSEALGNRLQMSLLCIHRYVSKHPSKVASGEVLRGTQSGKLRVGRTDTRSCYILWEMAQRHKGLVYVTSLEALGHFPPLLLRLWEMGIWWTLLHFK